MHELSFTACPATLVHMLPLEMPEFVDLYFGELNMRPNEARERFIERAVNSAVFIWTDYKLYNLDVSDSHGFSVRVCLQHKDARR